jgi:Domain of unknown function (DUF4276)
MARSRYVIPFLGCEGPNDREFLLPVLRKLFEQAALDHDFELVETFLTDEYVSYSSGAQMSFTDWVVKTARQAVENGDGDAILCIHTDEDGDLNAAKAKIEKARQALQAAGGLSAGLIAVIPVRMIEAWVLADAVTLCQRLNPDLPPHKLELATDPESYPDAKKKLYETHALAHADRRRRQPARIEVGELYAAMGNDLTLQMLGRVDSFKQFVVDVANAFSALKASY